MSVGGPVVWQRFETLSDASAALAGAVALRLRALIEKTGAALIAVPGGTTPARFLMGLGAHDLPWRKVTLLPTDERFVAADDPASNERMIREAFAPLREDKARFVSFHGFGSDMEAAAASLGARLAELPPIDLLVSGMGADGHIASLFPGQVAAGPAVPDSGIVVARPPGLPPRLSLSAGRLASAGWAALLVAGQDKAATLSAAQASPGDYPVGLLLGRPQGLDVYWAKA